MKRTKRSAKGQVPISGASVGGSAFPSRSTSSSQKTPRRQALGEIIQEIELLGLWRAKFFEHAAFYGGTALRILYGLDRFSEDLDFTLLAPAANFKLLTYCNSVREELAAYGFACEVEPKAKGTQTATESAFIKAETVVHQIKVGANIRGIKGELLKVKFEVDTSPAMGFNTQVKQAI